MSRYYVINQTEDSLYIEELSYSDLKNRLNEDYYSPPFRLNLPEFSDGCFTNAGVIIIKGEIIVPKPVEVVKKYELS